MLINPNEDSNSSTYGYDILRIIHNTRMHIEHNSLITKSMHIHIWHAQVRYIAYNFLQSWFMFLWAGQKNSYTSQRALSTILSVQYFNALEVIQSYAKSHGKSEWMLNLFLLIIAANVFNLGKMIDREKDTCGRRNARALQIRGAEFHSLWLCGFVIEYNVIRPIHCAYEPSRNWIGPKENSIYFYLY